MASITTLQVSRSEAERICSLSESHFLDFKSKEILPGKLTRAMSAFANAEGGDLYVGIDEDKLASKMSWNGFPSVEAANSHIATFEQVFPLGEEFTYTFISCKDLPGLVLKAEIHKSREVRTATDGKAYIRRGASSLPVDTPEGIERLRRNKGIVSFESNTISVAPDVIIESDTTSAFLKQVIPAALPENWMKKQQLIVGGLPTVGGIVLFADEPQAVLPKRCGIKVYRYKTTADAGSRETLDFDPISIEGPVLDQIYNAVSQTIQIIESVRVVGTLGLEPVKYPKDALHEVITNAVLHRDYSVADDIHIRIFDNRVEVVSPGTLPAHITKENILDERFSRNGMIVRLINKFPDPPNKDVGEGLNTAFAAMRDMKLKPPVIHTQGNNVMVALRHEPMATPEEIILEYLSTHPQITNKQSREICFIGSENRMKVILQRMVRQDLLELVPERTRYTAAYRLPRKDSLPKDVDKAQAADLFSEPTLVVGEASWCLHCERAASTADWNRLEGCPYCEAMQWDQQSWKDFQELHPEYPDVPIEGERYPQYS